ncbi:MAG: hypothetical protein JWN72_972, partial [Thermoleophilia bacterium]|nr:hypothetical protein [Thermoleophilia bacterium]
APVAGVKLRRGTKGTVIATWKRVKGADGYNVELLIGSAKRGTVLRATSNKLTLTPRSPLVVRVRVQPVAGFGVMGPWSKAAGVTAVKLGKPAKKRAHK